MTDIEGRMTKVETLLEQQAILLEQHRRHQEENQKLLTELFAVRLDSFQKSIDGLAERKGEDKQSINSRLNNHAGRIDDLESWRDRFRGAMVVAVVVGNLVGGGVVAAIARLTAGGG